MRAKRILTLALGLFVMAAVAVIAWRSMSRRAPESSGRAMPVRAESPARSLASAQPASASLMAAPALPAPVVETPAVAPPPKPVRSATAVVRAKPVARVVAETQPAPRPHRIVAMYFHGNIRCATCRKIEAYAKEAVEEGFREQVAAGVVEFRAVNVEEPGNRHFIDDYQLTNKSVVVTEEVEGKVARWVKLDNVWGLVGNHEAYLAYVQDAVRAYVED